MGFQKFSFLALSILVLCQAGSFEVMTFRPPLENTPDSTSFSEEEAHLLLDALMQAYVQRKTRELALELQQEADGSSVTAQKRGCNTATCVIHWLAGLLSRSGGVVKDNFVSTDVGSTAFGRRRRDSEV